MVISTLCLCGFYILGTSVTQTPFPNSMALPGVAPSFSLLLAGLDVQYCSWATPTAPARRCSDAEASSIDTGSRTDTLIFIEFEGTQVHLLSLPRDTQVGNEFRKINASYKLGGIPQLTQDVEVLLNRRVDYVTLVKTEYVERIIDALGGLDVEIPQGQRIDFVDRAAGINFHLSSGKHHLSGRDAVLFLRVRKGFGDDYGRMDRQKTAIAQLLAKLRSPEGLRALPTLISGFTEGVETNMDSTLIGQMVPHLQSYRLTMATLPTQEMPGTSYLKPDVEAYRSMETDSHPDQNVSEILAQTRIRLINSSGSPEMGYRLKRYLELKGFKIDALETTASTEIQSQVVTYNRTRAADLYAHFLGFPRLQALRSATPPGDVDILLGRDALQQFLTLQSMPVPKQL